MTLEDGLAYLKKVTEREIRLRSEDQEEDPLWCLSMGVRAGVFNVLVLMGYEDAALDATRAAEEGD